MIVMKFGGSSLKNAESINNGAQIIKTKLSFQPVIVISAMGKTTRKILNCCLAAANQDQPESHKILKSLKDYHFEVSKKLNLFKTDTDFEEILQSYFARIETNLEKIQSEKKLSPKLQDSTLANGEMLSSLILSVYLKSIEIDAQLMDARQCVITDNHFTHAIPQESKCYPKIHEYFSSAIKNNQIPVTQGFIGATESGETTTLGFEGSDYSAVLIGTALHVNEIQIWKDVPGVMSADPALIKSAIPVEQMTFNEAIELSRCGAKVLHPSTIKPASDSNILVKIFNSRQPEFKGTVINNNIKNESNPVKSITYRRELTILKITAKQSLSEFDFSAQVFVTLRDLEMSPEIIEGSDKKVILIIKNSELNESFFKQISEWADVQIEKSMATISMIGNMIRNRHEVIKKIHKFEDSHSIQFDIDKTSEHSYTVLLNENDLNVVIQQLHHDLFENLNT